MTDYLSKDSPSWIQISPGLQHHPQIFHNIKIQETLEKQRNSITLSLGDLQMNDQGASQVAEFLQKHSHFSEIDIRGNDITGSGFADIFEALRSSRSLRKFSGEWNNIGSDPLGLLALSKLVKSNPNLRTIDLRNNNVTSKCSEALSKLILEASGPIYIDLRWNKITDDGAKDILRTLAKNNKVKVDLSGNKISEEILMDIQTILNVQNNTDQAPLSALNQIQNAYGNFGEKNPFQRDLGEFSIYGNSEKSTPLYERSNNVSRGETTRSNGMRGSNKAQLYTAKENTKLSTQNENKQKGKDSQEEREAYANLREAISNLEDLVEKERTKSSNAEKEIERLFAEKEFKNAEKHELQLQYDNLTEVLRERNNQFKEACFQVEHLTNMNQGLKNELKKFEEEHVRTVQVFNHKLQELAERNKREIKELMFDKQSVKFQIEKIKNQCQEQMEDLQSKSEKKYRQYEQELHSLSALNAELSAEVTRQATYIQSMQHKQNDHLRDTLIHIKGEEEKKAQLIKKNLEVEFSVVQEANKQLHQKYLARVEEAENLQRINKENQAQFISERNQLKEQIEGLLKEINKMNGIIIQQKNELNEKDNTILSLEDEINNMKKDFKVNEIGQFDKLERVKRDFEFEKKKYIENEEKLNYKILERNRELEEAKKEIKKLKSDYERVADTLRGNMSKIITETFLENSRPEELILH